jgi:glycosyltransferase involved in cell wall biosynthesis
VPTMRQFVGELQPDLLVLLHDVWNFRPVSAFQGINAASWAPIDSEPLSQGDRGFFSTSGVRPIAMSRHGQRMFEQEGYDALYVPHGIDTKKLWTPASAEERAEFREQMHIAPDEFLIGSIGTNVDPFRKSWPQNLQAFAAFHAKHPKTIYSMSTMQYQKNSLDMVGLAARCGLEMPVIRWVSQAAQYTGTLPQETLRKWYCCLDVLLNCSHAEGFGLCAIEAQACGTPVINTDGHTGPELVGPGWLVAGEPWYNPTHDAFWTIPSIQGMIRALNKAHGEWLNDGLQKRRINARLFAEGYDADVIWPYWEKALEELTPDAQAG